MTDLSLVWRLVTHARGRALLLLTAVTVAFCTFGILDALRFSLNSGNDAISGRRLIVMHEAGLMQTLPLAHVDKIRQLPGIAHVGHATWQGAYFREQSNMFMSFAVDPAGWLATHPDMNLDAHTRAAFLNEPRGMLVSAALASKFGLKPGDAVPVQSIMYAAPRGEPAWTYIVSGIFQPSADGGGRNYAVTHYRYLNENRDFWRDSVGSIIVTPAPGVSAETAAQRIDAALAGSEAPTSSRSDRAFHTEFFSQFGDVLAMIRAVISVTFLSLILMVTTGMALSVRQHRQHIGVLRVIGYSPVRILGLVLSQSMLQIGSGALLGLVAAFAVNFTITRIWPHMLPDISLPLPVILQGIGMALGLALLAALVPALVALRIKPVNAMAQELA